VKGFCSVELFEVSEASRSFTVLVLCYKYPCL
jgi:hypothetical protein